MMVLLFAEVNLVLDITELAKFTNIPP